MNKELLYGGSFSAFRLLKIVAGYMVRQCRAIHIYNEDTGKLVWLKS